MFVIKDWLKQTALPWTHVSQEALASSVLGSKEECANHKCTRLLPALPQHTWDCRLQTWGAVRKYHFERLNYFLWPRAFPKHITLFQNQFFNSKKLEVVVTSFLSCGDNLQLFANSWKEFLSPKSTVLCLSPNWRNLCYNVNFKHVISNYLTGNISVPWVGCVWRPHSVTMDVSFVGDPAPQVMLLRLQEMS